MTFHPDKTRTYAESGDEFGPYPYALGNISLRRDITKSLSFNINLERDNILQNSMNIRLISRTDHFKFEFGPFLGLTDSAGKPDAGIIGELELTFPGIFYISIHGSSTLGSKIDKFSPNTRETLGTKTGFWIKSTVISLYADYKSLSWQKEEYLTIRDANVRFCACLDFFGKNSKVTGNVFTGYQKYYRYYKRGNLETSDALSSWLAGAEFNFQVTRPLGIIIGFEVPFYNVPENPLTVTNRFILLSKLYAGFVYSFR